MPYRIAERKQLTSASRRIFGVSGALVIHVRAPIEEVRERLDPLLASDEFERLGAIVTNPKAMARSFPVENPMLRATIVEAFGVEQESETRVQVDFRIRHGLLVFSTLWVFGIVFLFVATSATPWHALLDFRLFALTAAPVVLACLFEASIARIRRRLIEALRPLDCEVSGAQGIASFDEANERFDRWLKDRFR